MRFKGGPTQDEVMAASILKIGIKLEDMVAEVSNERLMEIAGKAEPMKFLITGPFEKEGAKGVTIAVPRDRSFCFYYPEGLEALEAAGEKVFTFRPIEGDGLPDCYAADMGGR